MKNYAANFNKKSLKFDRKEFIKFSVDYLLDNDIYVNFERDDLETIDFVTKESLNNINFYIFMFGYRDENIKFKDLMKKYYNSI